MTVKEIVLEKLNELGADGLCNDYAGCYCTIKNLAICGVMFHDCLKCKVGKYIKNEFISLEVKK